MFLLTQAAFLGRRYENGKWHDKLRATSLYSKGGWETIFFSLLLAWIIFINHFTHYIVTHLRTKSGQKCRRNLDRKGTKGFGKLKVLLLCERMNKDTCWPVYINLFYNPFSALDSGANLNEEALSYFPYS